VYADEVADRFLGISRHPDARELACTVQACEARPDRLGVLGTTCSSTSAVSGRSTATAMVSLCTSSPM
jgi:hypothetical protein